MGTTSWGWSHRLAPPPSWLGKIGGEEGMKTQVNWVSEESCSVECFLDRLSTFNENGAETIEIIL